MWKDWASWTTRSCIMSEKILIFTTYLHTRVFPRPKNRVSWKLPVHFWSSFPFFLKQECTRPFRRNCSLKRRPICSNPSGKQGKSSRRKELFSWKLHLCILSFSSYVLKYVKHLKHNKFKFWSTLTGTGWPQNENIS